MGGSASFSTNNFNLKKGLFVIIGIAQLMNFPVHCLIPWDPLQVQLGVIHPLTIEQKSPFLLNFYISLKNSMRLHSKKNNFFVALLYCVLLLNKLIVFYQCIKILCFSNSFILLKSAVLFYFGLWTSNIRILISDAYLTY